jgi:hypothetical protein
MSTENQLTENHKVKDLEALKAEAMLSLQSDTNATLVIDEYSKTYWGKQDLFALTDAVGDSIAKVQAGNLKKCEGMLMGQAMALQSIFVKLSRMSNKQDSLRAIETLLRLALKAQSQCRNTLETLANIKNPSVIYAKQANIAAGHQQVNNSVVTSNVTEPMTPQGSKKTFSQNELLSESTHETLDDRRTTKTSGNDTTLETVAAVNRG